ncbi:MAG: ABC transporter permease [Muribaculaceae bacterium]|nr:ABC transporter permease [Muribaculaceae bacterium]
MSEYGFRAGVRRELRRWSRRRIYLFGMVLVPLFVTMFFLNLLKEGLPEHVPTAVVDLDHSALSRSLTRSLEAMDVIAIDHYCESYDDALAQVRRGDIFGFFVIPANFEKQTFAGEGPTLEYYSNMTYFVPGTLAFKGFKTAAVTTSAGIVRQTLVSLGLSEAQSMAMIQPLDIQIFALNNPWMNYSYYLTPSFAMATFVLMIMLMTTFQFTSEIKQGTSTQWLATARGSIFEAVLSKLFPATIVYFAVALCFLWLLFGLSHFPLNGSLGVLIAATLLTVTASQAFGLMVAAIVPNVRLAFSICALFGILCFSFAGFSFPVQSMYGAIGIFSWIAPVRYWFLIYINDALNGVDIYYSRMYFVALIVFIFLPWIFIRRLRKAALNPVYVP